MDPTETAQLEFKLCSRESFNDVSSSKEMTKTTREKRECSHSNPSVQSDGEERNKYFAPDVFLSHSGAQKNFVRQLHQDLIREGVSCFFDEDPQNLPIAEKFPLRIFEAAETCRIAVFILSKEFIQSKWPMLELSACVKAKNSGKNPNLKLLPLIFKISKNSLSQITQGNQDWEKLGNSEETWVEWHHALKEIRSINGLHLSEGENQVSFREKVVRAIRTLLDPASPRYFVSFMQGQARMCQEVANLFKNVSSEENGIQIAGLYGVAGSGKTTVSMAFCNLNLKDFEGKVCHVEFQRGKTIQTVKHVLQYLTHSNETLLNSIQTKEVGWEMFHKRVRSQRVLLALDNITEDPEIIEEVRVYLSAQFASGSYILLNARSLKILINFIPEKSCMHAPSLTEEEAIAILLEKTGIRESTLEPEYRGFALKCAKRCWFKDSFGGRKFHPLALKAFRGYLLSKFDSDFSKWADKISNLPKAAGGDLHDVFTILDKAYDDMGVKYQTIFILLAIFLPPKVSQDNVLEWLAIVCNKEIHYIDNAVQGLIKKAFIERIEPEVRIHNLLVEFAQNKVNEMEKWLWVTGKESSPRQLITDDNGGFELIKFQDCRYQNPSMIRKKFLKNLLALQLVDMHNLSELNLSSMDNARCITIYNCRNLERIQGMNNLPNLAWLQICQIKSSMKLSTLSSLCALQHLEIDIPNYTELVEDGNPVMPEYNHSPIQLGDLTGCVFLKEIYVRCPLLSEFPVVNRLPYLEKVEFSDCFNVIGPLNCTGCSQLRSIVISFCSQMTRLPTISDCVKLSKIVLWQCDALTICPDIDGRSALETLELYISSEAGESPMHLDSCLGLKNLQLWNMWRLTKLPDFRYLSRLTTLKLHECGIHEPPNLTNCPFLENVSFFTLKYLERFPSFSELRALKILILCNCNMVPAPPDIRGCNQLRLLYLLYNNKMEGLPQMPDCPSLEEIKLSWHNQDEVIYVDDNAHGDNSEEVEDDDLEFCLNYWKDETLQNLNGLSVPAALKEWKWLQCKTMLVKRYFRGVKLYYSITAPYETYTPRRLQFHEFPEELDSSPYHVSLKYKPAVSPIIQPQSMVNFKIDVIRRRRRVHEMKWAHEEEYDIMLFVGESSLDLEAELDQPLWPLFERLGKEDCQRMEQKRKCEEVWLETWKEWEVKWDETWSHKLNAKAQTDQISDQTMWQWIEWDFSWQNHWQEKWKGNLEEFGDEELSQWKEMVTKRLKWELEFRNEVDRQPGWEQCSLHRALVQKVDRYFRLLQEEKGRTKGVDSYYSVLQERGMAKLVDSYISLVQEGGRKTTGSCTHYTRRCRIRAPCCNEVYDCHICHNEAMSHLQDPKKSHELPRFSVQWVICTHCNTEQNVKQVCENCGVKMGEYYCSVCKIFDDDISKEQFHCDDCGVCRLGGRNRFFHCKKCGGCYSVDFRQSHSCLENSMHQNCPVCFEYLHYSMKKMTLLHCGHIMHVECYTKMKVHLQYSCPICFDMS